MADDVASFFKSKKSKKHGSGQRGHASVQNPDALARRLERTVQQQQVFDRENGIDENDEESEQSRPPYTQQMSGGGGAGAVGGTGVGGEQNNEDSEWLDYQDQQEIDVAKFGIGEMEIREESDSEINEDEESTGNRKTWKLPGQEQGKQAQQPKKMTYAAGMDVDDGDEGVSADEKSASAPKPEESEKKHEEEVAETTKTETEKEEGGQKGKYVPPSLRNKQLAAVSRQTPASKQPNIEDSMEFPSLAAAGELQAEIEKTKKKKPPPQFSKKAASPAPVHAPSPAPAEETPPSRPSEPVATTPGPVPESKLASQPPKNAYVPPHLRKQGGGS